MAVSYSNYSIEDKISFLRSTVFKRFTAFAPVCSWLKFIYDKELPAPAGVTPKKFFVNPELFNKLTKPQAIFVFLHEYYHIAREHHFRMGMRNPTIWNIACDYFINLSLQDNLIRSLNSKVKIEMPPNLYIDEKYRGMSEEQIYNLLVKDIDDKLKEECSGDIIMEDMDEESIDKVKELIETGIKLEQQEGRKTFGDDFYEFSEKRRKNVVNWKSELNRVVAPAFPIKRSWNIPNKKLFHRGNIARGFVKGGCGELVVSVDTSGSIFNNPEIVNQFIAEISNIVAKVLPMKTHCLWHHSNIWKKDVYSPGQKVIVNQMQSGGTCFQDVFDYSKKVRPQVLIMLTDMLATIPEKPSFPVIWCSILENELDRANYGKKIFIPEPHKNV